MATSKRKFSLDKLKKTDQLVVRTGKDQNIDRVIFPNPVEVGLDSDTLRSALTSHGGVKLPAGKPSDTQNVLYNENGVLKFNGNQVVTDTAGTVNLSSLGVTGAVDIKGPLKVTGGIVTDDAQSEFIRAGDRIRVTKNSDGSFTITADIQGGTGSGGSSDPQYLTLAKSSDLNNERVFTAGTGLSVNDEGSGGNFTVSVDDTKIPLLDRPNTFDSDVTVSGKIKGSIQKLSNGTTDFIQGGTNVTVTNNADGSISLSSADTDTTYSAGNGMSLSGTTFSVNLKPGGGLQLSGASLSVNTSELSGNGLKVDTDGKLAIEPSNFAGTGLEDSGGNLRISTSAAGSGLDGGGLNPLSVKADSTTGGNVTPVNVTANGVGLDVSTIAGSGVSADGSGNVKLDINSISGGTLSSFEGTDLVAISDTGDNVTKKVELSSLKTYINTGQTSFAAGDGLKLDTDTFRQRAVLTVANNGTVFTVDGKVQPIISSPKTLNFYFDLSHTSLSGKNFRLSTTPDGTFGGGSEFTNGVTTSGTPGTAGAYLEVKFTQEDPDVLYYYDANGSGRGGKLITGMGYLETDSAAVTYKGKGNFPEGIEGSIQKLSDGTTDYIQGGNNITVTNNANGSITIDSDVAGAFTAGDGIEITGGVISTDLRAGSGLKITSGEVDLDDTIVAKLAGATFGGSVTVPGAGGIRGSIQKLSDGTTNFIQAGDNVTVTNNANGSITIASTGGGGGGGSGNIGAAEDGDYTDGLFTDFTASTNVGTAVDRFNEVLKALAPDPAPNLSAISATTSGATCKLSFDASKAIGGYVNVGNSAGLGSSVNANGLYTSATSSGNIRIGAVTSGTTITGIVASGVTANTFAGGVVNYPANSLGSGDQGSLSLTVNGVLRKTLNLADDSVGSGDPGSGTGTSLDNGSGFINISSAASGKFSNGSGFEVFKHRTLNFQVGPNHQGNGWNYVQISHTIGSTTHTTNFIEWVVDETKDSGGSAEPLGVAGQSLGSLSMTGTRHISGVEYNTGGTATYTATVNNAYKDVYSSGNITFSGTSCSAPSQSFPAIGDSEDSSKSLSLIATATINDTKMLNEAMALSVNVPHPIRANLSGAGSASISGLLVYNVNENSTVLIENFNGETYRLRRGVYNNQTDITGATWNSEVNIVTGGGVAGHTGGLLVYNDKLVSPTNGLNGGDFRKTSEGGNILNGPAGNVNYSSTAGTKQYYRRFTNNSGGSKTNFNLSMSMTGTTVVLSDDTINNANIAVAVKLPQTSTGFGTAWLDIKKPFATGQVDTDGDGCLVGSFDSGNNSTNQCTFGTQSAGNGEYIILRVTANSNWTGSISQISVSWL